VSKLCLRKEIDVFLLQNRVAFAARENVEPVESFIRLRKSFRKDRVIKIKYK
jgi:hypothetical protein